MTEKLLAVAEWRRKTPRRRHGLIVGAKFLVYPLRLNRSVVQKEQQREADEESPCVDEITLGRFFSALLNQDKRFDCDISSTVNGSSASIPSNKSISWAALLTDAL